MLVSDVFSYLDELAPFSYSMDFDNSGLLIGDPSQSAQKNSGSTGLHKIRSEQSQRDGSRLDCYPSSGYL